MNFFEKWLAGLKGGPMVAWATGVTAAQWTFLADYAPQMGVLPRSAFAGVTFFVCCALYFINPKSRDWLPAEGLPADFIRDVAAALLEERLPQLQDTIGKALLGTAERPTTPSRPTTPPPVQSLTRATPPPVIHVPPPPAPAPAPAPTNPTGDPNRTLTDDEALGEIMQTLQTAAVLMQNRIHRGGQS